jgi:hypothetical protein
MRYRWFKLLVLSLAIAVAAIVAIVKWASAGDPRSLAHSDSVDNFLHGLLPLMVLIGIVGVVAAIIGYAVKLLNAVERQVPNSSVVSGPQGFPVSITDGPGQYRIEGVHRETKMDMSKYIQADGAANARVKAELDGIVVTSIKKIPV